MDRPDLILALTPFERPNARVAAAAARAGALGVLDLGRDRARALAALQDTVRWSPGPFGVRVPPGCPLAPGDLPASVDTVILAAGAPWLPAEAGPSRRVLVEVTSPAEAQAVRSDADGVIAKGSEAGGRVGELSTFVLLQRLLAEPGLGVPVWASGGIGLHTAAGAVAGGAAGVVLDAQLALTSESVESLPAEVVDAIAAMDGSETAVVGGHRVYTRPDLHSTRPAPAELSEVARRLGPELRPGWLPIGQDGAFAGTLAQRYRTVGGVVQALRREIRAHLQAAVLTRPLAEGSGIARAPDLDGSAPAGLGRVRPQAAGAEPLGALRFPVAQGPMTRVSDSTAFAAEVAGAGGLPFIALALMSGDDAGRLLAEAAEVLAGRPWGVGILGFVPSELREAQLREVRSVRPPYALIAGGRPGQAAALEADGTRTFIHVPSPGLLDRFLADGARRFVFEGWECGGHIGPRASFPLWEAQIERLLAFGEGRQQGGPGFYESLGLLFAGGIHDHRSAAMVAALAAPLAERGAGVGVLMGTAYLFTHEAVAAGAILPGFQQAALDCDRTVLLETSPGHVTRCADTPFVAAFNRARDRLSSRAAAAGEMWAELEQLNLGRLRIATKGLRREGDALVDVPELEQREAGMFMLGQIATARSETTTIAALHEQVTERATEFLARRADDAGIPTTPEGRRGVTAIRDGSPEPKPLDVAVVGMACVLPQADGLARYWANILAGVDAVTEVPPDRWDPARYYEAATGGPNGQATGRRTPSKWGGFIPRVPFNALAYGIPPSSLAAIEPVQLLALEVAARALADAGYAERSFDRARASAVFGAEAGTDLGSAYLLRSLFPAYFGALPRELDEHLPALTEDSFPGVLANVIAGRIANRLDLGGVNYTVDAACASSLAALDASCKELQSGGSDLVLCGGADLHNGIHDYLMFTSAHALSGTGRCRTFDASADGIALGEGVVCIVLKRLADAERDGDRVYAVVKGIGASSDGRSLGLTAPRPEGQRRALERAYHAAGVSPSRVGLIEAHGTGTVVGDRTELSVLTEVFAEAGAAPGSCVLGSVKSQIGHTKCAAGLAGLVKAAAALHTGVRPPTNLREPNPSWDPEASPFFFDRQARPWLAAPGDRFAGISAFGFGGTNFHAVLQGYAGAPEPAHGLEQWPAELFCFRGNDAQALAALDELARLTEANDAAGRPWSLRAIAARSAAGAQPATPVRLALVADDLDDLARKLPVARALRTDRELAVFAAGEAAPGREPGKEPGREPGREATGRVAFLFPGQGSQRPGMLADLFVAFPRLQRHLRGDAAPYAAALFPPAAFRPDRKAAQRERITDTRVAQPVMGIAGTAVHELLEWLGVRADMAGGHSYGELVALSAAGTIRAADLLSVGEARAAAILGAAGKDPGTMAAVGADAAAVREILAAAAVEGVVVANHNAPEQVVVSGPTPAVAAAVAALEAAGLTVRGLPVACAFHSPVVAGAAATLGEELERREILPPAFEVWANATAAPYPDDPPGIRRLIARQVAEPVRFVEQIEAMYAAGARVFVEAGPGRVLTGLAGRILGNRSHAAVACDVPGESGLRRLLLALAELAAAGVAVDVARLFRGRTSAPKGDAPARPGWTVDGRVVRNAAGDPVPGGLRPASAFKGALPRSAALSHAPVPPPGGTDRESAVLQFLQVTREAIAAQREVMLGYLGVSSLQAGGMDEAPVSAISVPRAPASAPEPAGVPADGAQADPEAPEPITEKRLLETILAIVGQRTGYPREMLGANLDLEADLSIDSIKRTEIIMELAERMGLARAPARPKGTDATAWPSERDAVPVEEGITEQLAALKTIGAIVAWIMERAEAQPRPGSPTSGVLSSPGERNPPNLAPGGHAPAPARPQRYVVEVTSSANRPPEDSFADLGGLRFVVVDDGAGVGAATAAALRRRGADALVLDLHHDLESSCASVDGVIHLGALRTGKPPVLPAAFAPLRAAILGGARMLLVATGSGGTFGYGWDGSSATDPTPGLGLRGLARTVAREYPHVLVRAVDVDPADAPGHIAEHLLAELGAPPGPPSADPRADLGPVVGYTNGSRSGLRVVEADLAAPTGPAGFDAISAAARELGLGPESVVVLTGGGRGITAACAIALGRACGCHIEILGRTPSPEPSEDPATRAAGDQPSLRRALLAQGMRTTGDVEAAMRRILSTRELRATLESLSAISSSVRYHSVDVSEAEAVRRVIEDVHDRWGRIDGVVHGAGVLEDRMLADKTPESFDRVFRTKVDGARSLVAALQGRPPVRFFALFGSVSGVFGNPGQVDYAAANDALDTLARMWHGRVAHRVVSLDWGPWDSTGSGMVSPELEREYARRGIVTISPEDGVAALFAELAWGDRSNSQVIYLGGGSTAAPGEAARG